MDHLCYVDKKFFKRLELGDEICLRVRRSGRNGITWQVFERDFVYLASRQRPRRVEFKCMVYAVEEIGTGKECSQIETIPVCNVHRKLWNDREAGFIRVILVDRMRFSLPPSRGTLQACWEPIGTFQTLRKRGENNENS